MALVIADRVKETTTTTGTGTVTLAGAVTGFQSFAAIGNGNQTYYTIAGQSGGEWEVGIGTYTSSGTTLSRTTVLSSSNSGNLVNFSAGTKDVFVTYPAGRAVERDTSNILTLDAGTTTVPPLAFQSGTNLTSATAGAAEYNGTTLFFTPSGTQRGVVPGMQFYRLDSALAGANVNSVQKVFGVGCTLSANTVYAFQGLYAFSKSAGATSHSFGIGFGGTTATVNNIAYQLNGQYNGTGFTSVTTTIGNLQLEFVQSAVNFVLITGIASANAYLMFTVTGTVSVNVGGTFIPEYTLSAAPGGAYSTAAGSYFLIYPIGAAGSNTSVGTWA
jgi:hypothetical protein